RAPPVPSTTLFRSTIELPRPRLPGRNPWARQSRTCRQHAPASAILIVVDLQKSLSLIRRSLHAWQMNLERGSTKSRSPGRRSLRPSAQTSALVELVPTTRVQSWGTARYVVDVGVARIEFGEDATVATLQRILEALRSC